MASLIQTQASCDKKKYLESEKIGKDMSGSMDYCKVCTNKKQDSTCAIQHAERVRESACARAYKRLHKYK